MTIINKCATKDELYIKLDELIEEQKTKKFKERRRELEIQKQEQTNDILGDKLHALRDKKVNKKYNVKI